MAITWPYFYLMPFYSTHASNLDGIWKKHLTQNGCHVQMLRDNDTTIMQDARLIASCQVNSCILLLLELYTYVWSVFEQLRVHFARLVYTVFYVQEIYALSGLQIRGVSTIQGFSMYTSNGGSIGTWVNVYYIEGVRHSGVYTGIKKFKCTKRLEWYIASWLLHCNWYNYEIIEIIVNIRLRLAIGHATDVKSIAPFLI